MKSSTAVDLACLRKDEILLFEVKTSSTTTNVYTAVGQLQLHGQSISSEFNLKIRRLMVLPELPRADFIRNMPALGIELVTFERVDGRYKFAGFIG
ncbi:hypothetical protein ABE85_02140 [Mitsuaria sp. 7]|nr:hypothetical protein ABE85_02140 [Mitsuaria sp. 7]